MMTCVVLSAGALDSCPMKKYHPVYFNSNEYVITAEVNGYVGPMQSPDVRGEVYGLMIDTRQIIYAPERTHRKYVLFIYDVSTKCNPTGISKKWLSQRFPVGAEIRVVAQESRYFFPDSLSDEIYLEAWLKNNGSVSLNIRYGSLYSTADGEFDYLAYLDNYEDTKKKYRADKSYINFVLWWDSYKGQIDFEYRNDLWRLERLKSEKDRSKILERVLLNPYIRIQSIEEMILRYVTDEKMIEDLMMVRREHSNIVESIQDLLYNR
jgi:hypothetical protein